MYRFYKLNNGKERNGWGGQNCKLAHTWTSEPVSRGHNCCIRGKKSVSRSRRREILRGGDTSGRGRGEGREGKKTRRAAEAAQHAHKANQHDTRALSLSFLPPPSLCVRLSTFFLSLSLCPPRWTSSSSLKAINERGTFRPVGPNLVCWWQLFALQKA